jgi:Reverse transcriptase (RNA-dependent DNA polymerase).
VLNARDDNKQTIGLFLDLSKAFNMVNHQILIKKLNKYGLRGLAESWFASYLSNRKQIVII